jgi:anaerobic magnesium-protoporphyrin IX monomethyl ester cyclase
MYSVLISPPHIPMYINTDYNFVEIGEIAAYLQQTTGISLEVFDGGALGQTWSGVIELFLQNPDLVIVHCTPENMTEVARLISIAREMIPQVKIACYGRGAYHVSHLLQELKVDWIIVNQDWEVALSKIANCVEKNIKELIPGAYCLVNDEYKLSSPGLLLEGQWALPALSSLPIDSYRNIPGDEYSARGYGADFEFAIGISRGCNATCGYCPIPKVMGAREIFRQNLEETVDYLCAAFDKYNFTAVSLFGANFTYDAQYVERFCELMSQAPRALSWKCVTAPAYLNHSLIERMAKSGCSRIAVGVESIRPGGANRFQGRVSAGDILELGAMCKQSNVMLVCFVMGGLPGQSREELAYTLETISEAEAIPRPMIYYDFERLKSLQNINDVFWSNRKAVQQPNLRRNIPLSELMLVANNWTKWLTSYRSRQIAD